MKNRRHKSEKKQSYHKPKVLASYKKKDLEEIILPHGGTPNQSGGGGGCG